MSCYDLVKLPPCSERPLLPSVKRAVILAMRNSSRLTDDTLADLSRFCEETYIQWNEGWRKCKKPACVTSTAHDLIHAYKNACLACKDVEGPVLFFEEDAIVFERDATHYERVDEFLRRERFDIYSLGSFGEFCPRATPGELHRRFQEKVGFSQAMVWSETARRQVLSRPDGDTHVDVHAISALPRKYAYHLPLVVQLFPVTENMGSWCIACDDSVRERLVVSGWTTFLQRALHLDKRPDGWRTLYKMNDLIRWARRAGSALKGTLAYAVATLLIYTLLTRPCSAAASRVGSRVGARNA